MTIAICEDLPVDRAALCQALHNFALVKNICMKISEYTDGSELLNESIEVLADFELFFFDIYMPQSNGMEIAKLLRSRGVSAPFIFLTSSSDFAVESYDVAALSYLVKPIRVDKLQAAMERFLQRYRSRSIFLDDQLLVLDDIVFVESLLKNIFIHFKDGTTVKARYKLNDIESRLTSRRFLRCHQSYIINLDYVKRIENESFLTTLHQSVLIRKRNFTEICKAYYDYLKVITGISDRV